MSGADRSQPDPVSIKFFLDDAQDPFATYRPPAQVNLDTTQLPDGPHVLRIEAADALGHVGIRNVPFEVQNGPGITLTGLRANERVSGTLSLDVNAFSGSEPFDPIRAESSGPIPVWTWVMVALITAWAGWYAIAEFPTPEAFAITPTYASNPIAAANAPLRANAPPSYSGRGVSAGFDYAQTGPNLYAQNCSACHGASGMGAPGAFPPLAGDAVVNNRSPDEQIATIMHGLHGKIIGGKAYASQMPSFAQLSDDDIAAIIDHERTSWGNNAPTVTPDEVRRAR